MIPDQFREVREVLAFELDFIGGLCSILPGALKSPCYGVFPIIFKFEKFIQQGLRQALSNVSNPAASHTASPTDIFLRQLWL